MSKEDVGKKFLIDLDEDLHLKLKMKSVKERKTMHDLIIEGIERVVENE